VFLSRQRGLQLGTELSVVFVRGFVQIVAVGLVIGVLLTVLVAWSGFILLGMVGGATSISRRRGEGCPASHRCRFWGLPWAPGS